MSITIAGLEAVSITVDGTPVKEVTIDGTRVWSNTYGLEWDSATDTYTRLIGAEGKTTHPVGTSAGYKTTDFDTIYPWSEMKRCNLSDAGVVNAYYGDPTYATNDTNGQTMVEIPKFYYKYEKVGTKHRWLISKDLLTGYVVHPAFEKGGTVKDFIYVGAFEGTFDGPILMSRSGAQPSTGYPRYMYRDYSEVRGVGWESISYFVHHAIQVLYIIEYANFDAQETVGKGIVYTESTATRKAKNTGATVGNQSYGDANFSWDPANTANWETHMSYRGLENYWGNTWSFIDGINIRNGEVFVAKDNFADSTFTGSYYSLGINLISGVFDFIKDVHDGTFIPSALGNGATSASYWADKFYALNDKPAGVVRVGGCYDNSTSAGLFSMYAYDSLNTASYTLGGRIAYR